MSDNTASHVMIVLIGETPEYVAKIKAIADKANWFDEGTTIEIRAYESEEHFKFGIQMHTMARKLHVALLGVGVAAHLSSQHWILAAAKMEAAQTAIIDVAVDYNRLAIDRSIFEEQREMSLTEYHKVFSDQLCSLGKRPDEQQARRRGKKRRGHNHDRDRVIGGKGGYC